MMFKVQISIYPNPVFKEFIAHWGDYDLDNPLGSGKTEWEAIQDLIENSRETDWEVGGQ